MAKDVRVYRKKVFFYGEAKDELLYLANEMNVEPEEVVRIAIRNAREHWLAERPDLQDRPEEPGA